MGSVGRVSVGGTVGAQFTSSATRSIAVPLRDTARKIPAQITLTSGAARDAKSTVKISFGRTSDADRRAFLAQVRGRNNVVNRNADTTALRARDRVLRAGGTRREAAIAEARARAGATRRALETLSRKYPLVRII